MERKGALWEVAWLFLRLGGTAFGGPAAHIAMMEEEVVRRRGWLSEAEFLDLLGATNLIPGPNSTELAIHIGHRRAGWAGLVVAGLCFILPATLIVGAIAWGYVRFGRLPAVSAVLHGIKPIMIAIVLQALWSLGRSAIKDWRLGLVATAALAASLLHRNELVILVASGAAIAALRGARPAKKAAAVLVSPLALASTTGLFLSFLKIGAVLYGSGYVLLAFLRSEFVERLGWLSEGQLLDAIAVGQITPGPVFTTATFVGYVLAGPSGALAATAGIFLPAFVFVALSGPLVPRIRRSAVASAFLDGVNAASLALMAAVTWELGRAAIVDAWTVALALIALVLLVRGRVSSLWLILGGALAGLVLSQHAR